MIVLSGDLSGAAVRDAVTIGAEQQNFGLVDINGADTTVRLFHFNQREKFLDCDFDNVTWLPK